MSAPTVETVKQTIPQRRGYVTGKKIGRGPFVIEMSQADREAHDLGSYFRISPVALTDEERKELSDKVREANKRSSRR